MVDFENEDCLVTILVFALPQTCLSTEVEVQKRLPWVKGGQELKLSEPLTRASRSSSLSQPPVLTSSHLPHTTQHLAGN